MTIFPDKPAGLPQINFLIHEARPGGEPGARQEFEQMLALLVRAVHQEAHLIHSAGGDWGIDVLAGRLAGRIVAWQAKYFPHGVKHDQFTQIQRSFESACRAAARNGYQLAEWVLCIPSSMTPAVSRKWAAWADEQHALTGVVITLWDENELRALLLRPEAEDIARAFYYPYRAPEQPFAVPELRLEPAHPVPGRWCGGAEVRFGGASYLIHEPVEERASPDRSWVCRAATAGQIEPGPRRVRLRQVETDPSSPVGLAQQAGLRAQADLLAGAGGHRGLPLLLAQYAEVASTTLVTALPAAPSWQEVYGPVPVPPDRLVAAAALAAAVPVCASLAELHRRGQAHQALGPQAIVVAGRRRGLLRDAGLACLAADAEPGAIPYPAAEQQRLAMYRDGPGPATDVFQLAALLYHTLAGQPPPPTRRIPLHALLAGFPAELDALFDRALELEPGRRPTIGVLADALRKARRQLSQGVAP